MIEKDAGELKVDTLASCRSTNENTWSIGTLEAALSRQLGTMVTSFEYVHASLRKRIVDGRLQRIDAPKVRREDNDLFPRMNSPKVAKGSKQFPGLALLTIRNDR